MNWHGHIVGGPQVPDCERVIKDMQIVVDFVLERLADGQDLLRTHQ